MAPQEHRLRSAGEHVGVVALERAIEHLLGCRRLQHLMHRAWGAMEAEQAPCRTEHDLHGRRQAGEEGAVLGVEALGAPKVEVAHLLPEGIVGVGWPGLGRLALGESGSSSHASALPSTVGQPSSRRRSRTSCGCGPVAATSPRHRTSPRPSSASARTTASSAGRLPWMSATSASRPAGGRGSRISRCSAARTGRRGGTDA